MLKISNVPQRSYIVFNLCLEYLCQPFFKIAKGSHNTKNKQSKNTIRKDHQETLNKGSSEETWDRSLPLLTLIL